MGRTLIKKLNIIDLESTCYKNGFPDGEFMDIIEIGITQVDITQRVIEKSESIIVEPTTSEISEFCTELTTLTPKYINENGIAFPNALNVLKSSFNIRNIPWASWGDYDRKQFDRQCIRENILFPFHRTHLNIKFWFSMMMGIEEQMGVGRALKHLGLEFEGTQHRGVDDSINIARIWQEVLTNVQF